VYHLRLRWRSPDDSVVVQAVSGDGFQIGGDTPTWIVPSSLLYEHILMPIRPPEGPEWTTEADKYMFEITEPSGCAFGSVQRSHH
jgi:hypothetical protein